MNIYDLFPGLHVRPWHQINLDKEYERLNHKYSISMDMKLLFDQKHLLFCTSGGNRVYTYGGFGEDRSIIWHGFEEKAEKMIHLGTDFNNLPVGQPVASLCSGTVVDIWNDDSTFNGWGGRIVILEPETNRYCFL